jgi:hypothetical protein
VSGYEGTVELLKASTILSVLCIIMSATTACEHKRIVAADAYDTQHSFDLVFMVAMTLSVAKGE